MKTNNTTAEKAINDLTRIIPEGKTLDDYDIKQTLNEKGDYRIKTNQHFVLLFYRLLLDKIRDKSITHLDMEILLTILDFLQNNEVVSLSQADIAYTLGIDRAGVSKSYKRLVSVGFLIKNERGSYFLNPQVFCKGNTKHIKDTRSYEVSIKELEKSVRNNLGNAVSEEDIKKIVNDTKSF